MKFYLARDFTYLTQKVPSNVNTKWSKYQSIKRCQTIFKHLQKLHKNAIYLLERKMSTFSNKFLRDLKIIILQKNAPTSWYPERYVGHLTSSSLPNLLANHVSETIASARNTVIKRMHQAINRMLKLWLYCTNATPRNKNMIASHDEASSLRKYLIVV